MKISEDKKISLLDTLIKPANNNKPFKDTIVDGKSEKDMYDKVELSSRKQEIEKLKEKAKASPVIRLDKVDQMRESIKAETYNIRGQLVAKSILNNHILEAVL